MRAQDLTSPVPSVQRDTIRVELSREISEAVRRFSQDRDVTFFSTLSAAFTALVHHYIDQNEVCIGSDFANRERGNGAAKFDLGVTAIPHDDRIATIWEYNGDVFDRATVERMTGHFVRLLDAAVREPDTLLSRLPLLDPATSDPAPVHRQVIAQARRTPDALAVRDAQGDLTYADLLLRASRLARRLRRTGVGPGEIVSVCLPRSQGMVVAQLGILMTGAAYLPLDLGQSQARWAFIFTDAGSRTVITSRSLRTLLPSELEVLYLDELKEDGPLETSDVAPGDLACIVYASESTAGARFEQRALSNFIDSPVAEIWAALTSGASLHVAEDEIRPSPPLYRATG